jgi:hypothetical protein
VSRIHGRQGRVYLNIASGGTAEPIAFLSGWSISFATDKVDVTAFGDANKIYVAGLPDASGDFSGYYDDATAQVFTAALDGQPRKFYLYPSTNNNAQYFWGTILPDFKIDGSVTDAVKAASSWNASTDIRKVG